MDTIEVNLGTRSYPIHIGSGILSDTDLIGRSTAASQLLVVSNEVVAPLYLDSVASAFGDRQLNSLILPDGERYKTLESLSRIIDKLVAEKFHRDAAIIALGGGVIGDLAGFAAACYQRGIEFVQIPTTLLAQVDSAVGGKTAVNHPEAKNMIGAFHQPVAVLTDTDTLSTLPPRELAAGLAEVIKYGLIEDAGFVGWLEDSMDALLNQEPDALRYAIRRCCEIKAAIVAEDEHERGKRALLNLGHTFGHAIETLGGYGHWLHGEAVAIGITMAADLSQRLGLISASAVDRAEILLARAGLPTEIAGLEASSVRSAMELDKKAGSAGLRLILLHQIGEAFVTDAPDDELIRASIASRIAAPR
jgi:3-dehydroquinate synthase